MDSVKNKCKGFFSSRSCFGCCVRPATAAPIGKTSKRPRNPEQTAKQDSTSDQFWSTSPVEMESQKNFSLAGSMNQPLDPLSSAGASSSNPSEFVNQGLILWQQMRQQWVANKKPRNMKQNREPTISWNATYESLLGTGKRFSQPIPLPEMVDFLVDIWEQEGLYD